MPSPAEVAKSLASAAEEGALAFDVVLGRIWPDRGVHVVHTPPAQSDGVMQRERVMDGHRRAHQLLLEAMPDFRYTDISTVVDGNIVSLSYVQTGTLASGVCLSATNRFRFTFENGELTELWSGANPAEMAPFVALWSGAVNPTR